MKILLELQNFYRTYPINDETRDSIIDKILFQLTKFNPPNYGSYDVELISTYLRLIVQFNNMSMEVVAEFIYWYLEGGDRIR
jgi:hypothetical protein